MKKMFERYNDFRIVNCRFMSDYFVCSNPSCRHGAYLKVMGNTARCPECGSTMYRQ